MRILTRYMIVIVAAVLGAGTFAFGATNSAVKSNVELKAGNILNIGDQATFLYNGTEGVKDVICTGETIPVYKETPVFGLVKKTEVGAVKVLSYKGDDRFLAQVVEGRLTNGDVALKQSATCLLYHHES